MTEPAFLPFHAIVTAPAAVPSRAMLVLHGMLGSGGNFRSFAKSLAAACPDWAFVLVDLRAHGQSQDAPPPHTLDAAAEDLVRLGKTLAWPVRGVLGHSFGGKVALAYADKRGADLDQLFVLDSTPSVRPEGMTRVEAALVIEMLESLPWPLPSRERFFELLAEKGLARPIIEWLAMNVRRDGDVFRFRIDLSVVRALLADYFQRDLWSVLEAPSVPRQTHVVIGGRSDTVSEADRARLDELAKLDAKLHVHVLPRAAHWVHVDDPDGLLAIVRGALSC
jgi:pimeloyl-ACP methyl ester carboxylesterase